MNFTIEVLNSAAGNFSEALFRHHHEQPENEPGGLSYGVIGAGVMVSMLAAYAIKRHIFPAVQTPLRNHRIKKFDDNRDGLKRLKDFISALAKELKSRWERRYNPMKENAREIFPALQRESNTYPEQQWGDSSMLCVGFSGLNSSPLAFTKYIEEIVKFDTNASFFAPYILKKGYCKCKEAALPILKVIQAYADEHPKNHIFLIGHSRGAVIAADIEQKLKAYNVHLISIAGPHCGTKSVNWIGQLHLTKPFGISTDLVDELAFQGTKANKRLSKWNERQDAENTEKKIRRVFYASPSDWIVFPQETCFPDLPCSEYHSIPGESHVTIIDAVTLKVLSYIKSSCKTP